MLGYNIGDSLRLVRRKFLKYLQLGLVENRSHSVHLVGN